MRCTYICASAPAVVCTQQTVAGEFATRYLESLGVSPSRQTLELVHTCIPLTDKNVTTTLRVCTCDITPLHALNVLQGRNVCQLRLGVRNLACLHHSHARRKATSTMSFKSVCHQWFMQSACPKPSMGQTCCNWP